MDWDEIAAKLSEAFSAAKGKLVELKGRGCREGMVSGMQYESLSN